ncbi:MAG: hypothetical protein KBD37_05725 [Burkholderiales bacterium]|nr:hypothetical protein [Burkholderiales bacterium]
MKKSLLIKNKEVIVEKLSQTCLFNRSDLYRVVEDLKLAKLIPQYKNFKAVYEFFIEIGLIVYIFELNNRIIERYSMQKEINGYQLAYSIKSKSFFSMTTALNLQGYSDIRKDYIFLSSELTPKEIHTEELTQDSIDNAYKKPYRMTKNYGKFKENYIVLLSPKNTAQFEVIDFNNYRVSSINRAFVEIVINIQYFQGSLTVIQLFKPLKLQLDVTRIFTIIEKFNFIYPYYQLFGYMLEQIGFNKLELKDFKAKINSLKLYTDKNKMTYLYDEYWQIFYMDK